MKLEDMGEKFRVKILQAIATDKFGRETFNTITEIIQEAKTREEAMENIIREITNRRDHLEILVCKLCFLELGI